MGNKNSRHAVGLLLVTRQIPALTAIVLALFFGVLRASAGESNFVKRVGGMWRAGDYAGVRKIAQSRLAADTNDLAGLLLELEYNIEYLQLEAATNTAAAIVRVAPQITTPRFSEVGEIVAESAKVIIWAATNYPPDEYAKDIQRIGTITNKQLSCDFILRMLEEDGYFK